ncbi:MAG: hypothetical protein AB1540_07995 [Bdellovibrionota bacterium]
MRRMTLFVLTLTGLLVAQSVFAETRKFTFYAFEINGVKVWHPSSIHVNKGDTVEITAISKVPGPNSVHGFTIPAFKVVEVADTKGKTIKFVADKEGIHPIQCHLHPAHLGSQLVVHD